MLSARVHLVSTVLALSAVGPARGWVATYDLAERPLDVRVVGAPGDSLPEGWGSLASVAVGDLDGDGEPDLVAASRASLNRLGTDSGSGRAYGFHGPLAAGTSFDAADEAASLIVFGADRMELGASVAIGDFDGDGQDDLALGATGTGRSTVPRGQRGSVLIFFGPLAPGTVIDLATEEPGWRADGVDLDILGTRLAAGDLTGDGIDELVLGMHMATPGDGARRGAGEVHVLFGPLARGGRIDIDDDSGDVIVHGREGSGRKNADRLGFALAIADLDADGNDDLVFSAPNAIAAGRMEAGEVHVLFGPLRAGTLIDLAVDTTDLTVLGAHGTSMPRDVDGDQLGISLAVGDVSGDGLMDLVLGSTESDDLPRPPNAGRVDVVFGPFSAGVIDMAEPDSVDVVVLGAQPFAGLGTSASVAAGDLNGDGRAELVIGQYRADAPDGRRGAGDVLVFCRELPAGTTIDLASDAPDARIIGAATDDNVGRGVLTADISGDGLPDLIVAGQGVEHAGETGNGSGEVQVLVGDPCNRPPDCDAGGPYLLDCSTSPTCALGYEVQLDGTASHSALGSIRDWSWGVTCGPFGFLASGQTPLVCVSPSCDRPCFARLTVTDVAGNATSCVTTIELVDEVAPVIVDVPEDAVLPCSEVPPPADPEVIDACRARLLFEELREEGPCPDAYTLRRTWTASDGCNETTATQVLTVTDDSPPELVGVPADALVECTAVPLPARPTARDDCDPEPTVEFSERRVPGRCPGEEEILRTWTASDRCGNEGSETQVIRVVDTTPPRVEVGREVLACLWAPNHAFDCLNLDDVAPVVSDACSEPVTWRFGPCTSDQLADARGSGDGSSEPDCLVSDDGSEVCVRAERDGTGRSGRHYGITVVATDACGNESAATPVGSVFVSHDRRAPREDCRRPAR